MALFSNMADPTQHLSPHATIVRPELNGSRAVVPGSPLPQHYDSTEAPRHAGALMSPPMPTTPRGDRLAALGTRDSFSLPAVTKKFKVSVVAPIPDVRSPRTLDVLLTMLCFRFITVLKWHTLHRSY